MEIWLRRQVAFDCGKVNEVGRRSVCLPYQRPISSADRSCLRRACCCCCCCRSSCRAGWPSAHEKTRAFSNKRKAEGRAERTKSSSSCDAILASGSASIFGSHSSQMATEKLAAMQVYLQDHQLEPLLKVKSSQLPANGMGTNGEYSLHPCCMKKPQRRKTTQK